MLVERKNLGSVIKRLFSGDIKEMMSEVIQNSQRATASEVTFHTDFESGVLVIGDNGTGLSSQMGKPEQFLPLITVALSHYQNTEVEINQRPMGIGIFSLLAHQDVSEIEIHSNGLALTLETEEVWNNAQFWENQLWRDGITESKINSGVTFFIKATPKFCQDVENALTRETSVYGITRGYEDYLAAYFNDKKLDTSKPDVNALYNVLIETEFAGNKLFIGERKNYTHQSNVVNWYGQLISPLPSISGLDYYFEVKQNTPLTPKSPTRQGIVEDTLFADFKAFVTAQIRQFILDPANRERLTPKNLDKIYNHDKAWMDLNCPYFLGTELTRGDYPSSSEDFENFYGWSEVLAYADNLLVLNGEITICDSDNEILQTANNGISTFTDSIEKVAAQNGQAKVYILHTGNHNRLNIKELYWKPGAVEKRLSFIYAKGEFALVNFSDQEPQIEWQPLVQNDCVFAFADVENWSIFSADSLYVGANDLSEMRSFLETDAMAVWSYDHDTASSDEMEEEFKTSLDEALRRLFDNAITRNTLNLRLLQEQFGLKNGENIQSIEILPNGLKVTTTANQTLERVWLDCL